MYRLRSLSLRVPVARWRLFVPAVGLFLLGDGSGIGRAEAVRALGPERGLPEDVRFQLDEASGPSTAWKPADSATLEAAWLDVEQGNRPAAWKKVEPMYALRPARFATVEDLAYAAAVEAREAEVLGGRSAPSSAGRLLSDADYAALLAALAIRAGDHRTARRLIGSASASQSQALRIQQARLSVHRAPAAPEAYQKMAALEQTVGLTPSQLEDVRSLSIEWSLRYAQWADSRQESESAVRMLEWARSRFPAQSEVNLRLAWAYLDQSKPLLALELVGEMRRAGFSLELCAVGALAGMQAGDAAEAAYWTRRGLQSAPSDPTMLVLAARHAQLIGDARRAAANWRAAAERLGSEELGDARQRGSEPSNTGRIRIFGLGAEAVEVALRPASECGSFLGTARRGYCAAGLDATDQRM